MRIALLARHDHSPTTEALIKSAHRLGLDLEVLCVERLQVSISDGRTQMWRDGQKLHAENYDLIWPRLGPLSRDEGLMWLSAFESAGFHLLQTAPQVRASSDKIESLSFLQRRDLPLPASWIFSPSQSWRVSDLGEHPRYWIKTRFGSRGIGVSWANGAIHALAQADLIRMSQGSGVIQEHVEGQDLRLLVWRETVVGAMSRTASNQNPRGNLAQGSLAEKASDLPSPLLKQAVTAAQAFGLRLAGVDLIWSENRTCVLEVNASPGLTGISRATSQDLMARILEDLPSVLEDEKKRRF